MELPYLSLELYLLPSCNIVTGRARGIFIFSGWENSFSPFLQVLSSLYFLPIALLSVFQPWMVSLKAGIDFPYQTRKRTGKDCGFGQSEVPCKKTQVFEEEMNPFNSMVEAARQPC